MGHFLDKFVENVNNCEAMLKDSVLQNEQDIFNLNEDIEILTVNRKIALADDTINENESKEMEEFAKKT